MLWRHRGTRQGESREKAGSETKIHRPSVTDRATRGQLPLTESLPRHRPPILGTEGALGVQDVVASHTVGRALTQGDVGELKAANQGCT